MVNSKALIVSCSLAILPTVAIADSNSEPFFLDTYKYAKSSKIMNKAAKCELLAERLNHTNSRTFFITATSQLMVDGGYPSNKLLEYRLAYDVVTNYYGGRFELLDELGEANSNFNHAQLYKDLECSEFIK